MKWISTNPIILTSAIAALGLFLAPTIGQAQVYQNQYMNQNGSYYGNGYYQTYPSNQQAYSSYSYPPGISYYYNPLSVTCYPNSYSATVGGYVTWYAYASGGAGYYTYSWTGSGNMNNGGYAYNSGYYWNNPNTYSNNSTTAYYNYPGYQWATVTVRSGNQTISRSCGSVYVSGYQPYYYQQYYPTNQQYQPYQYQYQQTYPYYPYH